LRDFIATESAGAILLAAGAFIALVWANSPWSESYETLWTTRFGFNLGNMTLELDLRHWVNDGLMAIFFLVVGLEIKRELVDGHLSSRRTAIMPAVAALGGIVVPALIYLAIAGTTAPRGWAIPVATDIALAVGLLKVVARRAPASLRAYLLGLAIVDDIAAIVIIAVVYSTGVDFTWLAVAVLVTVLVVVLQRLDVSTTWIYVVLGCVLWFGLYEGSVHPTLAGVVMGLLAPSRPRVRPELIDEDDLVDLSDAEAAHQTSNLARSSVSQVEWLQHVLHPWTSFVIVPIFALANSGVSVALSALDDAVRSPITWGIIAGLVLGKPIGIFLTTRLLARANLADEPENATGRQLIGVGATAGIGFTVALFITELAFTDEAHRDNAKIGILIASILAAVLAGLILVRREPSAG
jgi:NhaA family Na+:H+ antiporter